MTSTDGESRRIQMASAALAPFRLSEAEVTVLAGLLHQTKVQKTRRALAAPASQAGSTGAAASRGAADSIRSSDSRRRTGPTALPPISDPAAAS
jgi:hypothetical protein